jgi:hypothetical protein
LSERRWFTSLPATFRGQVPGEPTRGTRHGEERDQELRTSSFNAGHLVHPFMQDGCAKGFEGEV